MIDFSALVLAPAMDTFAKPVTVTPLTSQPLGKPYCARGIWEVTEVDIVTENGGSLTSRTLKLGIMLSDYAFAPKQGDWISTIASNLPLAYWEGEFVPSANIDFLVDDFRPDGQGGAKLILKRVTR